MELILALVRDLDVTSAARAQINIFTLKRADAVLTANLLQQLFFGGGTNTARLGGGGGGLGGGGGGNLGGGGGGNLGGAGTTGGTRPLLTLTGNPSEGATLIDLRISVDERTNSVIVAGSANDLETISAIIGRLEDSNIQLRVNEVIKLRNSAAADVVNALQGFMTNSLSIIQSSNQLSGFQEYRQAVVLAAEPVTNTVLISASPEWFPRVLQMIEKLDMQPAQVAVQCLIAEVQLTNSEEFGVELGFQSPINFARGLIGTSSASLTTATGSPLPAGTSVTQTTSVVAAPGFNFNSATASQANLPNFNVVSPGAVALQGLGNLGVGRVSPTSGVGGFIFSGASDTVNILIRALKVQGRIDVLNTPNIQTLDNQTGEVTVGQIFPYITGAQISSLGTVTPIINYRTDVGVTLRVTPRISPEGRILMRVEPSIINPLSTQINIGNGLSATAFSNQAVSTTILAEDGETVVIGGLMSKQNTRSENKIPFFGDIPYVGALFRYRTQQQQKRELIIVLTPKIIRCAADADKLAIERIKLSDMNFKDAEKLYGRNWLLNSDGPQKPPGVPPLPPPGVIPDGVPPFPVVPPGNVLPPPVVTPGGPAPGGVVIPGDLPPTVVPAPQP
jgi:general secretion pathway protein D